LDVWKKHFGSIIPNPGSSSSDYARPVAWARALFELNPEDYFRVIGQWRNQHQRRRNLWKAVHEARPPLGNG
jgi:hypothetical protein